MNVTTNQSGDLVMALSKHRERGFIVQMRESNKRLHPDLRLNGNAAFLAQFLQPMYQQTSPSSVGALTDAPLITDGVCVWGFMDYQIKSFLEELEDGNEVLWQKGS